MMDDKMQRPGGKAIKVLLALSIAIPSASAQSSFDSLGYVVGIFGALALVYTYQLISRKNGLDAEIARQIALLRKVQGELKYAQEELKRVRQMAGMDDEGKIMSEMKKTQEVADSKRKELGMRREYWDRIETFSSITPENPELKALLDQKAETEAMMTATKAKYTELDEKSFKQIIEGYQRTIIELDTKIRKLKGEDHGS